METIYTLTYIGRRLNFGKLHHFYKVESPADSPVSKVVLDSKIGSFPIGTILEVPCIDDKSFRVNQGKAVGKEDDEEKILHWQNLDFSDSATFASNKNFSKIQKNEYDRCIESLSRMYWSLSASQRRAFMLRVITDMEK